MMIITIIISMMMMRPPPAVAFISPGPGVYLYYLILI